MPDITCADRFATVAHDAADSIAVRHDEASLTYRELAGQAGGIARLLTGCGIRPGDVVATVLDRSPLALAAMLGIWAAGAAYANIDPTDPDSRITTALPETEARVILADRANVRRVPGSILLDDVTGAPYQPVAGRARSDLAYLAIVPSPTGAPKAVQVKHSGVRNYVTALRERVGRLPRTFASTTTFASDFGNTSVYGALLTGGTLDIVDDETVSNPRAFAARLRKYPVGLLKCTPSQLTALIGNGDARRVLPTDVLVLGGEAVPSRLAKAVLTARPNLAVFNHYGPAETTIGVLMHRVTEADLGSAVVPIGRPLGGVEIAVLDEARRPVADGETGQLHIGGLAPGRGYAGDDELTEATFVELTEAESVVAGRFFASGDLVRRNENGDIEHVGRVDRQLEIGGHRIEPAEVESVLVAQRGIRQAVVTGERPKSDQPMELVAYLVGLVEHTDLRRRLRQSLPGSLLPSRIHQVVRIPMTRNGKTNVTALRKLAADALKPPAVPIQRTRTATERLIADAWCAVLKHVDVDVHTRFGDLGGDDGKSLAVLAKLHKDFPELTVAVLDAHPTIAELATALDAYEQEVSVS